jgi:hypothetical protein
MTIATGAAIARPLQGMNAMTLLKTLAGYTAHARFLAECDRDPQDPTLAMIAGEHVLPNGLSKAAFIWRGKRVVILDVPGSIKKRVLEVGPLVTQ